MPRILLEDVLTGRELVQRTRRRALRISVFVALLLGPPSLGSAGDELSRFYRDKSRSTLRAAFERAEARLGTVEVGMSEARFFEVMRLTELVHGGKPVDVLLEGYLAEASLRANREEPELRHLVLGYVEHGREEARAVVVIRDRRVVEVRRPVPVPPRLAGPAGVGPGTAEPLVPGALGHWMNEAPPTIAVLPPDTSGCEGSTVPLRVESDSRGSRELSFEWLKDRMPRPLFSSLRAAPCLVGRDDPERGLPGRFDHTVPCTGTMYVKWEGRGEDP